MTAGCKAALALIEKLADGEASPTEIRDAEAHVALCPDCREHLLALKAFATLSREARESLPPEPPDSYWEHLPRRILKRIDSEGLTRQSLWRRLLAPDMLRIQAIVVSCVLLVAVGVTVFRGGLRDMAAPALAPPPRQAPAPAVPAPSTVPGLPADEEEKRTQDQRADLSALGYLAETPPIARDEPAEAPVASFSDAAKTAQAPPPPEAPASVAATPAPEPARAREVVAEADRLLVVEERASSEEDAFQLLKQKRENEREAPLRSRAAANRALAVDSAGDSDPCAGWRRFLETYGGAGTRSDDARYELARCSLRRFEQAPAESSRETAIADAEAFLEHETEGPRAEEIRKALEAVRR